MKRLIVESPYAGDVERNTEFARNVCEFAAREHGYAPFASHLFYTQFLDDGDPDDRDLGIEAGLAWATRADLVWICLRPGEDLSDGMCRAIEFHRDGSTPMVGRRFEQDGTPVYDGMPIHFLDEERP